MRRGTTSGARWCRAAAIGFAATTVVAAAAHAEAPPVSVPRPLANQLGVSLGFVHHQTSDEIVRGLRWQGPGGELRFHYGHSSRVVEHVANLRVPIAVVTNRYGHGGLAWDIQLDYGVAARIATVRGVDILLGGRLRWDWAVQYYEDFDEEHIYWMNAYELGPLLMARWRPARDQLLTIELDSPVLALVSRPPQYRTYKIDRLTQVGFYFSKTNESLRLTTIHEHAAARLRLSYRYQVSAHVVLEGRYAFDAAYEAQPSRFLLLTHVLSAGVGYAF